jgi:peptide/nickel transport system permease protein
VARYVGIRCLQAIPVLIGITFVSFLLLQLVPGDPARIQLGTHASASQVAALRHELGLDRAFFDQYLSFLGGIAHFDFGESLTLHRPVGEVIWSRLGVTALLLLYSLLIALTLTVALGVLAAVRHGKPIDHAIRVFGLVFYVMPSFWLGLLLTLLFGLQLGWFPTVGYESGITGAFRTLTLPALTLALLMAPLFIRSLRASILDTLGRGFVEAAQARGFTQRRILFHHVLRVSSMSTVTLVGLMIGGVLSWLVVVENVFGLPGVGTLLVSAVSERDFPMVQGLAFVMAACVVVINLATDLMYAVIDPRVRL